MLNLYRKVGASQGQWKVSEQLQDHRTGGRDFGIAEYDYHSSYSAKHYHKREAQLLQR